MVVEQVLFDCRFLDIKVFLTDDPVWPQELGEGVEESFTDAALSVDFLSSESLLLDEEVLLNEDFLLGAIFLVGFPSSDESMLDE